MALSPLARLLYIGSWCDADREGRMVWKPSTLKVRYLPSDTCDVKAVCDELTERGLVIVYGDGLAVIPSFKNHQVINPKEGGSKLPPPSQEDLTRAPRVSDAPSLPSFPVPFPSLPERPRVQGSGAFEPGSLPRDHLHHALCGPEMKICLKPWEYKELARQYNEPDEIKTRVVMTQFLEILEKSVTPNEHIGPFNWVEKNFKVWMNSNGRVPAAIKVGKSVTDEIDDWAKS